jgi:hypothetical protein
MMPGRMGFGQLPRQVLVASCTQHASGDTIRTYSPDLLGRLSDINDVKTLAV